MQEGSDGVPALIADLRIRDVWLQQIVGMFVIIVTDSDAPSYMSCSATDVLVAAEEEKKYLTTAEAYHAPFSSFVVTVDEAVEHDGVLFLCHLAEGLS